MLKHQFFAHNHLQFTLKNVPIQNPQNRPIPPISAATLVYPTIRMNETAWHLPTWHESWIAVMKKLEDHTMKEGLR